MCGLTASTPNNRNASWLPLPNLLTYINLLQFTKQQKAFIGPQHGLKNLVQKAETTTKVTLMSHQKLYVDVCAP